MTKLFVHWDADGISAGFLTSFHVNNPQIIISDGEFGDVSKLEKGDWLIDQHPLADFEGTVIDHHQIDTYPLKRKYNLIVGNVPASLLAFNAFKEDIPKSQWWKVCVGIVGDGSPELIPFEIFESCHSLLNKIKTRAVWNDRTFEYNFRHWISYKLLSSPINALLRVKKYLEAIKLISESETPEDVIFDEGALKAKDEVKKDFRSIMKYCKAYDFPNLKVVIYDSNYRMGGYVATQIMEKDSEKTTTIAINRKDGHGSLRGELSLYWKAKLGGLDYAVIDGHPAFMGITIKKNYGVFIEDITKIING